MLVNLLLVITSTYYRRKTYKIYEAMLAHHIKTCKKTESSFATLTESTNKAVDLLKEVKEGAYDVKVLENLDLGNSLATN